MIVYSVVVTYNGAKWVNYCFDSLINSSIENHHIIAIDNGSTDNTVSIIREHFPEVEIIETGENLGFGKANNIGLKMALDDKADFVFLLNQDAWVEKNTILELSKVLKQNEDIGIVAPQQLKADHTLDESYQKYMVKFNKGRIAKHLNEVSFINAAAWLISFRCLSEIGGFAPIFFLYGEDNNYIDRLNYKGFKIAVFERAKFIHDRTNKDLSKYNDKQLALYLKHLFISHLSDVNEKMIIGYYRILLFCAIKTVYKFSLSKTKFYLRFLAFSLFYLILTIALFSKIWRTRKDSIKKCAFLNE